MRGLLRGFSGAPEGPRCALLWVLPPWGAPLLFVGCSFVFIACSFVCLFVCLFVVSLPCLFACLFCLSVCCLVFVCICLCFVCVCLLIAHQVLSFVSLCIYPFVCLFLSNLLVYLFVHLLVFVCFFVCISLHLRRYPNLCLSRGFATPRCSSTRSARLLASCCSRRQQLGGPTRAPPLPLEGPPQEQAQQKQKQQQQQRLPVLLLGWALSQQKLRRRGFLSRDNCASASHSRDELLLSPWPEGWRRRWGLLSSWGIRWAY